MHKIHINPDLGADAALDLGDEELQYLCSVALWELALRTDKEQFVAWLRANIDERVRRDNQVQAVRHQRDLEEFAAQVMLDIQRLPEATPETDDR